MRKLKNSISKRVFFKRHLNEAMQYFEALHLVDASVNDIYESALRYSGSGYFESLDIKQSETEILKFLEFLDSRQLSYVLEIGSHKGGSLFLWAQLLRGRNGHILSVDLPGGDFGGGLIGGAEQLFQSFVTSEQKLTTIRGDSHSMDTLSRVETLLEKQQIDFLFIDGDHSYDGVKLDYEMYSSLVRPGGVIAFHDTVHRPDAPKIEVYRLWNELKASGEECVDFIASNGGRKIGIGALIKK